MHTQPTQFTTAKATSTTNRRSKSLARGVAVAVAVAVVAFFSFVQGLHRPPHFMLGVDDHVAFGDAHDVHFDVAVIIVVVVLVGSAAAGVRVRMRVRVRVVRAAVDVAIRISAVGVAVRVAVRSSSSTTTTTPRLVVIAAVVARVAAGGGVVFEVVRQIVHDELFLRARGVIPHALQHVHFPGGADAGEEVQEDGRDFNVLRRKQTFNGANTSCWTSSNIF
jgi:hypothetical protein